jgi:hypothetical protein
LRIVFPFVEFKGHTNAREIAEVMIASCKATMPDVPIYQLTDMDTECLPGVEAIRRPRQADFALFALDHLIHLEEGDVLKLDSDVVVQKDVQHVFDLSFDLALTRRPLNDQTVSNSIRVWNPHNHGVMFLRRARKFFEYALKEYRASEKDGWMGAALAAEMAAASDVCRWIQVDGAIYNYTPKRKDEDVSHCAIVHYKGDRKWWILDSPESRASGASVIKRLQAA